MLHPYWKPKKKDIVHLFIVALYCLLYYTMHWISSTLYNQDKHMEKQQTAVIWSADGKEGRRFIDMEIVAWLQVFQTIFV